MPNLDFETYYISRVKQTFEARKDEKGWTVKVTIENFDGKRVPSVIINTTESIPCEAIDCVMKMLLSRDGVLIQDATEEELKYFESL